MQIRVEIIAESAEDVEKLVKALQVISKTRRKQRKTRTQAKRVQAQSPQAQAQVETLKSETLESEKTDVPEFVRDNPWLAVLAQKRARK